MCFAVKALAPQTEMCFFEWLPSLAIETLLYLREIDFLHRFSRFFFKRTSLFFPIRKWNYWIASYLSRRSRFPRTFDSLGKGGGYSMPVPRGKACPDGCMLHNLQSTAVTIAACLLASTIFTGVELIRLWNAPAAADLLCFNKVFKSLQLFVKNRSKGDDLFDRQNTSRGLTNTPVWLWWLILTRWIWQLFLKQSTARWWKNGGRLEEEAEGLSTCC